MISDQGQAIEANNLFKTSEQRKLMQVRVA